MYSQRIGRNDPCHCSSGKKYKNCCMGKGTCHLCGTFTKLSYEHVPPEAAYQLIFGKEKIYSYGFWDIYYGKKGKILQRGPGKYTLCESCNNNTGSWYAPAYIKFVDAIFQNYKSNNKPSLIEIEHENYPLQIIKQIFTMFFSINGERFHEVNKQLKDFVLCKNSTFLPSEYKVLVYLYPDNVHQLSTGVTGSLDGYIFSILSFFPLAFVLCFDKIPPWGRDGKEISCFLNYQYDEIAGIYLKLHSYNGPGKKELLPHSN